MRKKQKFILPLMLSCALAFGSAGLSATATQAPRIADGGMAQEQILTQDSMQSAANLAASERSLPAGAQRTGVNINGRQVLSEGTLDNDALKTTGRAIRVG